MNPNDVKSNVQSNDPPVPITTPPPDASIVPALKHPKNLLVIFVLVFLLVLSGVVFYFLFSKTEKNVPVTLPVAENSTKTTFDSDVPLKREYKNSDFISVSYPETFKVSEGNDPAYKLVRFLPQPQPIEFGPFITFTERAGKNTDLLKNIQDEYKANLISTDSVVIGDRTWLHAVIRDDYFENVAYEYYFMKSSSANKYLAVIFSKNTVHTEDFLEMISSVVVNK